MAATNRSIGPVACPGCGSKYEFPAAMVGKRGRCAKCGVEFTVPVPVATKPDPPRQSDAPQYIGVACYLCGTRMYGSPSQVGQKLKCPDCGARTELPPPPKPKAKNIPAAMEGEQYELWDADAQPLPSELIARQPKYIAVRCRQCDTLMYATEQQVGQRIACPDCGTKHIVPPPCEPKPAHSPVVSDADAPKIDPAADPGERPATIAPEINKLIYEEQQAGEYARALAKSRRTGRRMEIDSRGRPILPRWPLITGVVPFLFTPGVPVRWLALAIGFYFSGTTALSGLKDATGGGYNAVYGIIFFVIGAIATMIFSSLAASFLLAIVTESSDGNKQIQNWPFVFEWFTDLFFVALAAVVSSFPGWVIGQLALDNPTQQIMAVAATAGVCFPVMLLSQLDIGSPWAIVSPRVLWSILRFPFSWLTFYVETTALIAGCVAAGVYLASRGYDPLLAVAPLGVAVLFLYGRLLGRLGWCLAEA